MGPNTVSAVTLGAPPLTNGTHSMQPMLPALLQPAEAPPVSSPGALLVLFSPGGASASGRASISTSSRCGGRGAGCWRVTGGAKRKDRALDSQLQASISTSLECSLVLFPPTLGKVTLLLSGCSCPGPVPGTEDWEGSRGPLRTCCLKAET